MALKGQAKTDYQREYMRRRRARGSNTKGLTGTYVGSNRRSNQIGKMGYEPPRRTGPIDADGNFLPDD